jgi:translation initiation factor RLI1
MITLSIGIDTSFPLRQPRLELDEFVAEADDWSPVERCCHDLAVLDELARDLHLLVGRTAMYGVLAVHHSWIARIR